MILNGTEESKLVSNWPFNKKIFGLVKQMAYGHVVTWVHVGVHVDLVAILPSALVRGYFIKQINRISIYLYILEIIH